MDFISRLLALAEPVPFTVAILMAKSLMRVAVDAGIGGLALWGRRARPSLQCVRRSRVPAPAARVLRRRRAANARRTSACPTRRSDNVQRTGRSERIDLRPSPSRAVSAAAAQRRTVAA